MIVEQGGLPSFDQIEKGTGRMAGLSGLTLFRYEITSKLISFIDVDRPDLRFEASIESWISNAIKFNIHTKGFLGDASQKHPDLYGMRLALAAYHYFLSQGAKIDEFHAVWAQEESPENLDVFRNKFYELSPYYQRGLLTEDEHDQIAIRDTFSYRLAVNLGFPHIDCIFYTRQGFRQVMHIIFKRPIEEQTDSKN